MAFENHKIVLPFQAASAVGAGVPVFANIASSRDEVVVPVGSLNQDILGVAIATAASALNSVPVCIEGVVKCVAAASLGAGARVAVGTTTGRLIPLTPSGLSTALGSALGAQGLRFVVGRALDAAADGDVFSVLLGPEQII